MTLWGQEKFISNVRGAPNNWSVFHGGMATKWVGFRERALCGFSRSPKYRQPPHLLDLKPTSEEARVGQKVSFRPLWGLVSTRGHAGTQYYVWIRLALFSNSHHSQLESPGWWFYSIFNILGQTFWQGSINNTLGWVWNETDNSNLAVEKTQILTRMVFNILWFWFSLIITISSLSLFNPQWPKAQPPGL